MISTSRRASSRPRAPRRDSGHGGTVPDRGRSCRPACFGRTRRCRRVRSPRSCRRPLGSGKASRAGARVGLNIAEVPLELPESPADVREASEPDTGRSEALGLRSDGSGRCNKRTTRRAHRRDFGHRQSIARRCPGNASSTDSGRGEGQSWSSFTPLPATARAPWPPNGAKPSPFRGCRTHGWPSTATTTTRPGFWRI